MKTIKNLRIHHFLVILLLFVSVYGYSQTSDNVSINFSIKDVDERLKEALADDQLSADTIDTLKEVAQKTKSNLRLAQDWHEKNNFYQKNIDSANEKINEYKDSKPIPTKIQNFDKLSLGTLEQESTQLENELQQTEQEYNQLTQEINQRAERRIEIPKQLLDLKAKLHSRQSDFAEFRNKELTDKTALMRSMLLKANILAINNEMEACDKELLMYDVTINLIPLKQDFLNRKSQLLKETIAKVNKALTKKRTEEIQVLASKTETRYPELKDLAESNRLLALQLTGPKGIIWKLDQVTKQSDKAKKDLNDLDRLFSDIKTKVDATGMTPALGLFMRNKKDSFAGLDIYWQDSRSIMAEIQTQILQFEEERGKLSDIEVAVAGLLGKNKGSLDQVERKQVGESAKRIIEIRISLLEKMIKNLNLYFIELVEIDTYQRLFLAKLKHFRSFVDEHLIWYKSVPRIDLQDLKKSWSFALCLFHPREWDFALVLLYNDFQQEFILYGCFFLLIAILLFSHRRLDKAITDLSENVLNFETDSLICTFKGILFSLLRILSIPIILIFTGWRLLDEVAGNLFIHGLAQGLIQCGMVLLVLKMTAIFCKEGGVGDIHFKWNSESLALIRKHLHWFTPIAGALFFLSPLLSVVPTDNLGMGKSFHRFLFVIQMLVFAVFIFQVVNPLKGPVRRFLDKRKGSLSERIRYLWYFPSATYLFLGILAMLGYVYTAQQFDLRLQKSFLLLIFLSFIYGLSFRWLIFIRRKLALERLRKRQGAKESQDADTTGENKETVLESESLYAMGQDTKKILSIILFIIVLFSLWVIWKDLFPAFNMFNRINLWTVSQTVSETMEKTADGIRTIQKVIPITLADLLLAIGFLFMTFMIVRNLSGILQMLILQHLPLDQGTRFAIITITRYSITLIGILIACAYIGISWSKVQWLVAAVSVGLGFGLQEIFGNFISGLIILMEQPIRVGDVVTIGEVTGYVTQIKIRATTITDWNKKELIVPNKEFITSRLVNWSLSDKVIRLTIPVGIAYGSDTKKAEKVLYKVAEDQPDVLADPAPTVLFDEFGESSLTFELRVFIPSFDYFFETKHGLHMKIDAAFRDAGIEIAFPQRDIHIRSIEPPLKLEQNPVKSNKK